MKRSITVFPEFENNHLIQELRRKYDPLHNLIPSHITLVFPFTSNIAGDCLKEHMAEKLLGVEPFEIKLKEITGDNGEYLFLNVKTGNDQLIRIHDLLYSGILKGFLFRRVSYNPHLTVGRLPGTQDFDRALRDTENFNEEFRTVIKKIIIETIEEDGRSNPEFCYNLGS
ncbi:2'-5' RNA ligase family protein [Bacillus salacetis]|uniref:2'-5' RNA ligase family protein n=1 Tax=Bacillus salacetis TaxID=2315464 RepID=A0A3A1R0G9_9BACI|nr:2'-5' RNA ligase family protein [Bacillus salacetis]